MVRIIQYERELKRCEVVIYASQNYAALLPKNAAKNACQTLKLQTTGEESSAKKRRPTLRAIHVQL